MKLQHPTGDGAMSPSRAARYGPDWGPNVAARVVTGVSRGYVARGPEEIVDAINIALQLAFILIFVIVLARYLRDPREVHRDLVLVFASVVALFAIAIARDGLARHAAADQPAGQPSSCCSSRSSPCGWPATSCRSRDRC